ncbi:MAG: ATP-grasp domain-containing protein [Candidatus Helarchaeota archaeon]
MVSNKSILVLGVNSRPIAVSARRLGYKVYVVDFWGDNDLRKITKDILVIKEQKGLYSDLMKGNVKFSDALVDLAKKMIRQHPSISCILVGSGLDDRYDLWEELWHLRQVIGNKPESVKLVRDKSKIEKYLKNTGIRYPITKTAHNIDNVYDFYERFGCPIVVRAGWASGGGRGILKINNEDEINKIWDQIGKGSGNSNKKDVWPNRVILQNYIPGIDISATSVNFKDTVQIISVNEQLIGVEQFGAPTPFAYCGNIIPFKTDQHMIEKIKEMAIKLFKKLKLNGINGIDLKLYNNELYFMEINPRFPGTIELLEKLTKFNMIKLHIDACNGKIRCPMIPRNKFGMKVIIYSKKNITITKSLRKKIYYDIPNVGTNIKKGEPILTIQIIGHSRSNIINTVNKYVENLYLFELNR